MEKHVDKNQKQVDRIACRGGRAMEYERILAIGDLHGNFDRLLSLFHKIRFRPENDLLVLLGDYIDRGPENMRCIRWAMEMSEKENVVALRGNHEQMMLDYYSMEGPYSDIWLPNGGRSTKRDLDAWMEKEPDALERVLDFIRCRPLYHRLSFKGMEYIFCHAGLRPGIPLEEQKEEDLLWIRNEFYRSYNGTSIVVVGHTPTLYLKSGCPTPMFLKNNIILVDTGSYFPEGRISCIDVLSKNIWQSDANLYTDI